MSANTTHQNSVTIILLKLAANGENKFIETDSLYHSTYADLPTSVVLILIC